MHVADFDEICLFQAALSMYADFRTRHLVIRCGNFSVSLVVSRSRLAWVVLLSAAVASTTNASRLMNSLAPPARGATPQLQWLLENSHQIASRPNTPGLSNTSAVEPIDRTLLFCSHFKRF
jgi:hypothetical protein